MNDAFEAEVASLRRAAVDRARSRPVVPFPGHVHDGEIAGVPSRRYAPERGHGSRTLVFLHGGYGIFGDLDLQDAWCRCLADTWASIVVSLAYPLAPEHRLTESVDAVIHAIRDLGPQDSRPRSNQSPIVVGDSAGAALALAVAVTLNLSHEHLVGGLLLTNPNIDLTLRRFDEHAFDGPDHRLSSRGFSRWTRGWPHSADFVDHAASLPATFIAVGTRDAVHGEACALGDALAAVGTDCALEQYDHGHGFLSDSAASHDVARRSREFFARHPWGRVLAPGSPRRNC